MTWDGLEPPYATVVADPPWEHGGFPVSAWGRKGETRSRIPLPYSSMRLEAICAMPVAELVGADAHLYLWTTAKFLRDAYGVAEAWGFRPAQVLVWCKEPMGSGPGGAFAVTNEFVLFCRRGKLAAVQRCPTSWWVMPRQRSGVGPRTAHSVKPDQFLDVVERVSPGPYVELFARAPRLGWDSWGKGFES